MFDVIVILVILVVVFGSSFIEEQAKKQAARAKKQYDYDAKVVKDIGHQLKSFLMIGGKVLVHCLYRLFQIIKRKSFRMLE
jgi:hypothetical protein